MKIKILLFSIILLAFSLRFFKLAQFPATLYGDEQAFAWNAYNILKLGQDEYGNPYPLQFRSFEDYKAPIPVYLLVPFIKFLGLNAFAIRLPIALASTLSVVVTFFLARIFFKKKISLIITFLMTTSPWHTHLSRGFFEATLALFFFLLGIYFFLNSKLNRRYIVASIIFFGLSLYSYFVPRILVPVFSTFLLWYLIKYIKLRNLKDYFLGFLILILISLPLIKLTFFDKGFSRFNKLIDLTNPVVENTVWRERLASNLPTNFKILFHNKATVWLRIIKNNYLEQLSPNFWYVYGDSSLRYFLGNMGMFYLIEFPFLLIGLYYMWSERRSVAIFFIGWVLLSAVPASFVGRAFAVRSLQMVPAIFMFVGYGLYKSISLVSRIKYRSNLISLIIVIFFVLSLGSVLIRYYFEYPVYAATWWGWENKAALDYAKKLENQYDYIFISNFYTGAELAYAVYTSYDPLKYRQAVQNPIVMADGRHLIKLGKYYFGSLDIDNDRLRQNIIPFKSLYIARPEETDSEETINAPDDGRVIFKIYKTK